MKERSFRVEIRSVSKTFVGPEGELLALHPIDLNVREGEFICLVGPSGCGKTTLLNIVAGLEKASSGIALVDGKAITDPGRDRMMMFQEAALFPWRTAIGNIEFGLEFVPGLSKADRRSTAREYLELVGLSAFENSYVHQLSGGMKQRIALARALAPNPRVLLMDEPFAALDAMTREQLYQDLQKICAARGKTVFFVTHNVREAACLGDRVAVFSARPGALLEVVSVQLPRPRDINDAEVSRIAREISQVLRSGTLRIAA